MQDLIGKKVTVHTTIGTLDHQDVGVVEAVDSTVLKLKKTGDEIYYFVIQNIRVIKIF